MVEVDPHPLSEQPLPGSFWNHIKSVGFFRRFLPGTAGDPSFEPRESLTLNTVDHVSEPVLHVVRGSVRASRRGLSRHYTPISVTNRGDEESVLGLQTV